MKKRRLGDSDLEITEISLGSWLTYSGGVERDQTEACTRAAFDAGINFFDTANAYGDGAAESAWGEILADFPREDYILATKVFFKGSAGGGLSAEQIRKQIDLSLGRLKTDHVDLYQCHRFDVDIPIEETMEALAEVVESGKARYIGFSEWTPEQIRAGLEAAPGDLKFVSSQPQYSMLWRAPEAEVFDLCSENGISQVVWSPLAEGVLTGKYEPGEDVPEDSRAASDEMSTFIKQRLTDETLEAVQRLKPIAEGAGLSMPQLALAWILRRDEVASTIIGASRPEQVHQNIEASEVELSADVLEAIDEALGDVPVTGTTLAPGASAGTSRRRAEGERAERTIWLATIARELAPALLACRKRGGRHRTGCLKSRRRSNLPTPGVSLTSSAPGSVARRFPLSTSSRKCARPISGAGGRTAAARKPGSTSKDLAWPVRFSNL
jgi:aryl-alcohol dehydrogenase-like predicted oxidoreductase